MNVMIYAKVHDTESGIIVALCDSSLINEILEEGDMTINIRDYSDFYKGSLMSADEAEKLFDMNIDSANVVGKEATDIAIKKGVIEENGILLIGKIPYAQAYKLK